jgi:hypothetical protein
VSEPESGKRPSDAAERAAASAERRGSAAARPAAGTEPPSEPPPREAEEERGGSPVTHAFGYAVRMTGAGLKAAGAFCRELLRRLPRP